MGSTFMWCITGLIILETLGRVWLGRLNMAFIRSRRGQVPSFMASELTPETSAQSADYSCEKLTFGEKRLIFENALVLGALFCGFFAWVDHLTRVASSSSLIQGLLFLAILGFAQYLATLPFSLYSTFRLEKKYGFNRTTPRIYAVDQLKGLILSCVLGIPLYALVLYAFEKMGAHWWIDTWLIILAFTLVLTWVFPEYIAPLFNRFSPLEDQDLLKQIDGLSEKTGFNLTRVQVMDASRRSNHSNAYFTGFGKTKKIVLFDTLIKQIPQAGIISVLAHELGHFKLKHVIRGLVLGQVTTFIALACLGWFIGQEWFYQAFGIEKSLHGSLMIFSILSGAVGFWWTPVSAWISRKHEFEADRYAVEIVRTGEDLKRALIGLSKENLSAPQPHPFYSRFYYSHPPLAERIAAIDREVAGLPTK